MGNRRPPRREGHGPARGSGPAGPAHRNRNRNRPPVPGPPRPDSPSPSRSQQKPGDADRPDRLQKVLAHAGVGSRRACEELILQGRVTVDGQVVRELGTRVDPARQKVAVDGQRIHPERMVYYAVSKPKGYVSTNHDPAGKPRVIDILPEIPERVYAVGRLDEQSTGLMILTNDGALANRLAHPRYGVEKLYRVVVAGSPNQEVLAKLTAGVWLAEGKVRAKRVRITGTKGQATILEMTLAEGKNREVRRMLAALGHKVMSLTRVAVGPITLKGLAPGEYRPLSAYEVGLLRKVAAGLPVPGPRTTDRPRPPKRGAVRVQSQPPRVPSSPGTGAAAGRGPRVSGGPSPSPSTGATTPSPRGPQRAPVRPYTSSARGRAGVGRRPAPPPSGSAGAHSPRPSGPAGARPPRPSGPPPSRRPASAGPSRPRLAPLPDPEANEPRRRIIGLDSAPAGSDRPRTQKPMPKRPLPPRFGLGPRRPRRAKDEGDS